VNVLDLPKIFVKSTVPFTPWIYSTSVENGHEEDSAEVLVERKDGEVFGTAMVTGSDKLRYRIHTPFSEQRLSDIWKDRVIQNLELNKKLVKGDAFRAVFSEASWLPGLVIDVYGPYVVVELTVKWWEKFEKDIVDLLMNEGYSGVYVRRFMELTGQEVYGEIEPVVVEQYGVKFKVDILNSQKTGLFLDQRMNRIVAARLSKSLFGEGFTCLDVFSNTGGFGLYMLKEGAKHVTFVDSVKRVLEAARENVELNGFGLEKCSFEKINVVRSAEKLSQKSYDVVVLDPPAFAKKRGDLEAAKKAYLRVNIEGMKRVKRGGLLVTCSCSGVLSRFEFRKLISKALRKARRIGNILYEGRADMDHPSNPYIPETDYLKCLILRIF